MWEFSLVIIKSVVFTSNYNVVQFFEREQLIDEI